MSAKGRRESKNLKRARQLAAGKRVTNSPQQQREAVTSDVAVVKADYQPPQWVTAPRARAPRKALCLRDQDGSEKRLELSQKAFYKIGREGDGLDIALGAATLSRLHAMVVHNEDGEVFIVDLRSTNGTYVNGDHRIEPFDPYPLKDGASVKFGVDGLEEMAGAYVEACLESRPSRDPEPDRASVTSKIATNAESCALKKRPVAEAPASEVSPLTASSMPAKKQRLTIGGAAVATAGGVASGSGSISTSTSSSTSMASRASTAQGLKRSTAAPGNVAPSKDPVKAKGSAPSASGGAADKKKCDKCDGPHATDVCPHFKKARETHKDAWANYGKKHPAHMGGDSGHFVLRSARCVRQPGDGSCLFHSLCFGLNGERGNRTGGAGHNAGALRRELAKFIEENPRFEIAGDTLEEWVRWDANTNCGNYARKMSRGGWGGGIEMAACSRLKKVNVHVYEQKRGQYKRISCFNHSKASKTIHVLYQGRMHYDALVV